MENGENSDRKEKFKRFAEAIEDRVGDIGANRGTTGRTASTVIEYLFTKSSGNSIDIRDEDIEDAFDVVEKRS